MQYEKKRDADLLARFMQSFRYYSQWHRENRNPAFVPWHTQAYYLMWRKTQDPDLSGFIFEMNDWLLGLQQWGQRYLRRRAGPVLRPGSTPSRLAARLLDRRVSGRSDRRFPAGAATRRTPSVPKPIASPSRAGYAV